MDEISIKVNIADVVYPLKITLKEEENVRKAAKLINEKVKEYKENYHISDKANLLSMVALQFATELLQTRDSSRELNNEINDTVGEIRELLDRSL